jgi:hypothetical protein
LLRLSQSVLVQDLALGPLIGITSKGHSKSENKGGSHMVPANRAISVGEIALVAIAVCLILALIFGWG